MFVKYIVITKIIVIFFACNINKYSPEEEDPSFFLFLLEERVFLCKLGSSFLPDDSASSEINL